MSIEKSALSSKFRPLTTRERNEQSTFRKQQAVFYTLRSLVWEESKGRIYAFGGLCQQRCCGR